MRLHIHLISIWLLRIVAVIAAVLIFSSLRTGRLSAIYKCHLGQTRRERLFLASFSFFVTFAAVRALTHAIRAGLGPFHNVEMGGRHIHHLVWGISLLLLVGYGWLLELGSGVSGTSTWMGRLMALLYGIGAALTLDEFALWLNLEDVYWLPQGRESIEAVLLFGSLLSVGVWGAPFIRAMGREVVRLFTGGSGAKPKEKHG
jgi:hypothetical protein